MEKGSGDGRGRPLDALHAASRVLRDANRTSHVLVPLLEAVARALDCALAEAWLAEPSGRRMSLLVDWCPGVDSYPVLRARHARCSFERGDGLIGRVWASGQAAAERSDTAPRGLPRLSWAAPVTVGGSVCAVFAFHGAEGDPDDRSVLAGLDAIAGQAGATIERIEVQRIATRYHLADSRWLEAVPDAVAVLDHQGRVREWNGAASRVLGHDRASVEGTDLVSRVAPRRWLRRYRRAVSRALTGRAGWLERRLEAPVLDRDGRERVVEMTLTHLRRDRVPSLVIHARDVTEARADRLALRRACARAQAETKSRDDFLAMLAHELQNPLAPIVATLELLDPTDPAGVERAVGLLQRHAAHLTELLDDLLAVARTAHEKRTVERGPVRVTEALHRAVEMVAPMVAKRQQRLDMEVRGEPYVRGDRARLEQIFANLLTNASRHGRPGAPLHVSATADDESVRIVVQDDGEGMTRALLAKAFEPFGQGPAPAPGTSGLGLALARSLVELHGGQVHAHSVGPGRTRIEVSLPRHDDPADAARSADSDHAADPASEKKPRGNAPRSIVLVEDDEDSAELMALALTGRGHEVRIAGDGRSALSTIEAAPPDVALVDIGLPDMDGYAVARALRERGHEAVRLVALTGYGSPDDRRRAKDAGFDDHLVKPASVGDILKIIAPR